MWYRRDEDDSRSLLGGCSEAELPDERVDGRISTSDVLMWLVRNGLVSGKLEVMFAIPSLSGGSGRVGDGGRDNFQEGILRPYMLFSSRISPCLGTRLSRSISSTFDGPFPDANCSSMGEAVRVLFGLPFWCSVQSDGPLNTSTSNGLACKSADQTPVLWHSLNRHLLSRTPDPRFWISVAVHDLIR